MTNKDNILMPLVLANRSHQTMRHRLYRLSYQLHIEPLLNKYPFEISEENNNAWLSVEH